MSIQSQCNSAEIVPVSPKQPPAKNQRDWYPYYAGFTEEFVDAVLEEHLKDAKFVLDPWSGSGTTTAVCIKRGLSSKGVDINPALTLIARARLTPHSSQANLESLTTQILEIARDLDSQPHQEDLLQCWIRPDVVHRIRAIQDAIHHALEESESRPEPRDIHASADKLSILACFFYCVLFAVVRDLLDRFRTTNPMWLKNPDSYRCRIAPSWNTLSEMFQLQSDQLGNLLSLKHDPIYANGEPFKTGTATNLPFDEALFDAALTSPPYATRIDYVKGTLPELAVLGADEKFLSNLRRKTTGSPVVKGVTDDIAKPLKSACGISILEYIDSHSSKGSQSYYLPWMRNYLGNLQAGLAEINRTVDPRGTICVVVQDSYYKEFLIDLQCIVIETLDSLGRSFLCRHDHPAPNPRAQMDINAQPHTSKRHNTETLLVFGKSRSELSLRKK